MMTRQLLLPVAILGAGIASAAELKGLWEFDDPAALEKATVGNDFVVGGTPTYHATLLDDHATSLSGVVTTSGGVGSFFTAMPDLAANGGGAFVNQFSVLVDIFTPEESRGMWRTIFQTNANPDGNDGDYWLRSGDSHLGVGALGYSDAPHDETAWTRLVITVDLALEGGDAKSYLDGSLFYVHPTDEAVDGRFSVYPIDDTNLMHFFADNTESENPPMNVGVIAIYEGVLTEEEIAALGEAGDSVIPGEGLPLQLRFEGSDLAAGSLSLSWDSQDGKLYTVRSTDDLASAEPLQWPIVAGQEDLVATPPANTVTFPLAEDPVRFFVVEEFDAPPVSVFYDDFETGQGAWTTESTGSAGTEWAFGSPSNVGPSSAQSGTNCFGTNLADNYTDDAVISLRSPPIDLTSASAATVRWLQAIDIEDMFDSGTVNILDAADDSLLAEALGEIDGTNLSWEERSAPVPPAGLGHMIKIEFLFVSDDFNGAPQAGWYVDDVGVTVP